MTTSSRAPGRATAASSAAAQQAARTRFTAVLHPVDIAALERAFRRQKRLASAGVDGITVAASEPDREANLRDLCTRVHTRRYRPQRFPRLLLRLPTRTEPVDAGIGLRSIGYRPRHALNGSMASRSRRRGAGGGSRQHRPREPRRHHRRRHDPRTGEARSRVDVSLHPSPTGSESWRWRPQHGGRQWLAGCESWRPWA